MAFAGTVPNARENVVSALEQERDESEGSCRDSPETNGGVPANSVIAPWAQWTLHAWSPREAMAFPYASRSVSATIVFASSCLLLVSHEDSDGKPTAAIAEKMPNVTNTSSRVMPDLLRSDRCAELIDRQDNRDGDNGNREPNEDEQNRLHDRRDIFRRIVDVLVIKITQIEKSIFKRS